MLSRVHLGLDPRRRAQEPEQCELEKERDDYDETH